MSTITLTRPDHKGRTMQFLRHLLEMIVAMMLGMFAIGAVFGGVLAASESSLAEARLHHPELALLVMAVGMTVPMVAWMRHRGHAWRSSGEMAGAMFVPAFALMVCYWLGGVSSEPLCPLACATMIPSMIAVMLYRLDEYTGHPHKRSIAALPLA